MSGSGGPMGADPFSAMWSEWMRNWTQAAGAASASTAPPDMSAQMRKAFFESMSQQADQYMRSEAFLAAMKQAMDNALGWQQMLNQYLQKGVSAVQMPTRADADHIVRLVRGMEDRLIGKLDAVTQRVERLEKAAGVSGPPPARRKPRPTRRKPPEDKA